MNGEDETWTCIYAVRDGGLRSAIQNLVDATDFTSLTRTKQPRGGQEWITFRTATEGAQLLEIGIVAGDPQSAVHLGLQQLNHLILLINFYHGSAPLRVVPKVFACSARTQFFSDLDVTSIGGLHPQRSATKRALSLHRRVGRDEFPTSLTNALELRGAAYEATDVALRISKLWSALEALVSARPEESIQARVTAALVPTVTAGRTRKLLKYLAIRLNEDRITRRVPRECLPRSTAKRLHPADLLAAFVSPHRGTLAAYPKNSCLRDHIFGHTSPLDRYRLWRGWETYETPARVLKELKVSATRLQQHIARIYRARNLLVHHGRRVETLPYLLKNLEYYLLRRSVANA